MPKTRNSHLDIAPGGARFSRVVRSGSLVFIAGVTARGSDSQGAPFMDQLRVVLDRITRIVAAEGGTPGDITKFTTYVTSVEDWRATAQQNDALMEEFFQGEYPANTLVEIGALAEPGLDVEIEAIAVIE